MANAILLAEVEKICREVGIFQLQHWQKIGQSEIVDKGLNQLVSFVDRESEQKLMDQLRLLLPESVFIGEEFNPERILGSHPTWIIDPLDGTTNFLHGLPIFSISVALWRDGALQLGVVCCPALQESFTASLGEGAYLNGVRLELNKVIAMDHSLIATGFPYCEFEKMDAYLALLEALMRGTHGLRRMGSAAIDLAYTAAGRFDGFFEMGLAPWDIAAGVLLVQEAGGKVANFNGENGVLFAKQIVASNPSIFDHFLAIVRDKLS